MKWLAFGASLAILAPWGAAQESQDESGLDVPAQGVLKPGLVGQYWNVGKEMKKFPVDLVCEPATLCRVDGVIDFDVKEGRGFKDIPWKEYFAVVWTGVLRVPKDAEYTFYLKSHDGSTLCLDAKMVVDHDGTHPLKETASKSVTMKAGDHDIRVECFQNKEGPCVLSWKVEGTGKQVIPSTAFWHKFEKGLDLEAK
jgi:hypothetical protein